jgi:ketosteroid isomerase-like protein
VKRGGIMRIEAVLVFLGVCACLGCTPSAPETNLADEEQAIHKLNAAWFADEARRDMEASLSYMTSDVVIHMEGAPPIHGIEEMRSVYEEFFKIPYVDLARLDRTVVVAASGDIAYDIGPFNFVFEGEDGQTVSGAKSTIIWHKLDGEWKAVVASLSMNAPATTTVE